MAKRQLPKRLFKGQDRISSYKHNQSPAKLMKRVAREHEDVLQSIEFVLITCHREDRGMDDRDASEALRACLHGTEPADARIADLVNGLTSIRDFRADVGDDVWRDAVRVVDDSVHRHSKLRRGEKAYLEFVSQFIM